MSNTAVFRSIIDGKQQVAAITGVHYAGESSDSGVGGIECSRFGNNAACELFFGKPPGERSRIYACNCHDCLGIEAIFFETAEKSTKYFDRIARRHTIDFQSRSARDADRL